MLGLLRGHSCASCASSWGRGVVMDSMLERMKRLVADIAEEFGGDGPSAWDLETMGEEQFLEALGPLLSTHQLVLRSWWAPFTPPKDHTGEPE